jgi:hypothetical protein
MLERIADRVGIELTQKDERLGRDAVLRVEPLPGAAARSALQ